MARPVIVHLAVLLVIAASFASAASKAEEEALAYAKCHNITGTCLHHGFICASNEVVPHSKRCDGIEDCADGTDEFMCEHSLTTPLHEKTVEERAQLEQATCVHCNCKASTIEIKSSDGWHKFAMSSPVDYYGLATGAPSAYGGRPCNPKCTDRIKMTFYRKTGVCRGWLCCARQNQCISCFSGGQCPNSNNPGFFKRCYEQ